MINWYRAHQNIRDLDEIKREGSIKYIHRVGTFVGFYGCKPLYSEIEKFDLRYVVTGDFDDLANKYF